MNIIINDEYIEDTTHSINGVIYRNEDLDEIKNKFELLYKTVKYFTNKYLTSPSFTITGDKQKYKNCICSCSKCSEVYFVKDEETSIELAIGSSCIKKFSNKKLDTELYYITKAKRCVSCISPLVIKDNDYCPINAKRGDYFCNDCKYKKIYLKVSYQDKEDAKKYGTLWDNMNKKWYIHRSNKNYQYLIDKYK